MPNQERRLYGVRPGEDVDLRAPQLLAEDVTADCFLVGQIEFLVHGGRGGALRAPSGFLPVSQAAKQDMRQTQYGLHVYAMTEDVKRHESIPLVAPKQPEEISRPKT